MGKQFVRHTTRVVSTAHLPQFERAKQSPTKPPRHLFAASGCAEEISSTNMGRFTLGAVPVFWWFTNVMCVPKVHVSYCEWLLLLESLIQIGGTIAVLLNRWCLVQSQWVGRVAHSVWWLTGRSRDQTPGVHPASCRMGSSSFLEVKSGRDMLLTNHPLVVPWTWKSRAITLPTLWATTRPVIGTLSISVATWHLRTVSIGPAWTLNLSSCDFYPQGAQQKNV